MNGGADAAPTPEPIVDMLAFIPTSTMHTAYDMQRLYKHHPLQESEVSGPVRAWSARARNEITIALGEGCRTRSEAIAYVRTLPAIEAAVAAAGVHYLVQAEVIGCDIVWTARLSDAPPLAEAAVMAASYNEIANALFDLGFDIDCAASDHKRRLRRFTRPAYAATMAALPR